MKHEKLTDVTCTDSQQHWIFIPKGSNGTFRLFLDGGDAEMFEVSPVEVINQASFSIRVRDTGQLDYERIRDVDIPACCLMIMMLSCYDSYERCHYF